MKINVAAKQMRSTPLLEKSAIFILATFAILGLSGCSYSPSFNLLGSYFPAWIICFAVATAVTSLIHVVFTRTGIVKELWPLPVVYPCLISFLSCTLWIIFFN